MGRLFINMLFIFLLSIQVFPVKEIRNLLLGKQTCCEVLNDSDDDDCDTDMVKKMGSTTEFEFVVIHTAISQPIQSTELAYKEHGVYYPLNHAADVHTPPPNC
ncbi:hypothetical protein [Parasediminibacterium sp. JCM 36343]|uniref:hypothetical protein n=1 Tax=Parasediminibacterium sp. JCM 36343 TaxID=3374279 RepID=UPI00397A5A62